ncbi:hypothetical protein [Phaeodactylibacter luteus]|uniref:Uncharacterized protein n=1 Tax=Phaeodactylibacter luteus TaxID=1564516 RepID=A0A5C6S4K7_9BACT|nr:hypothetical protein [Phaeodactylibacter luteus]TXB68920.1 hypothetical protein FRY97_02305 [Phaeodactylibacter luteus]
MELHTQHCQYCGATSVKNILVRAPGESDKVFVACTQCNAFVASYVIAPLGYYHHGKGYESFLRGIHRSGEFMSGRNVKRMFEDRKEQDLEEFKKICQMLADRTEEEE